MGVTGHALLVSVAIGTNVRTKERYELIAVIKVVEPLCSVVLCCVVLCCVVLCCAVLCCVVLCCVVLCCVVLCCVVLCCVVLCCVVLCCVVLCCGGVGYETKVKTSMDLIFKTIGVSMNLHTKEHNYFLNVTYLSQTVFVLFYLYFESCKFIYLLLFYC